MSSLLLKYLISIWINIYRFISHGKLNSKQIAIYTEYVILPVQFVLILQLFFILPARALHWFWLALKFLKCIDFCDDFDIHVNYMDYFKELYGLFWRNYLNCIYNWNSLTWKILFGTGSYYLWKKSGKNYE